MAKATVSKQPRSKGKQPTRKRRLPLRWLVWLVVLGAACAGGGAFWYTRQEPSRQQEVQRQAATSLEWLRDSDATGRDVDAFIDRLLRLLPVSEGEAVTVGDLPGADRYTLAGLPVGRQPVRVLENIGYVAGYDEARQNPAWVAFHLAYTPEGRTVERPDRFATDRRTRASIDHNDYTGTGYDRGHMAPNYAIGVVYGEVAQRETFLMSNIVPQRPTLNRVFWRNIEERIANDYLKDFAEVWVITGPVYSPPDERLESGVAIPDAFFLIVADVVEDTQVRVLAFIVPQDVTEDARIDDYLVPVDAIEDATGFDFLSLLEDEAEDRLEALTAPHIW